SRAGLSDPNKPYGSFLFLGPTGVGKTELCKALAGFLFDSEDHLIRIDMSEYMEKHSVSRLIGAPPGYVGYEEGGQLTEAVRRKPYSVILLDEIEKAHPDVFNALLQILDDGRLTDGQGRVVNFKNSIVIMTSNIGSQEILSFQASDHPAAGHGGSYDRMKETVLGLLRQHFRPEFLNRVDEIIVFHALEQEQIREIAGLLLQRLATRVQQTQGSTLEWDQEAAGYLAKKGYDLAYGARPLKRLIQQEVETPLSRKIIAGEIGQGGAITLKGTPNGLFFEVAEK